MRIPLPSTLLFLFASAGLAYATTRPSTPATQPQPPASAPARVYATPLAACEAYCQLSITGDSAAFTHLVGISDASLKSIATALEEYRLAKSRVERALAAKFTKGETISAPDGFTMEVLMKSILARLPKAKVEISADGTKATVVYPAEAGPNHPSPDPFFCMKEGPGWKVDIVRTGPVGADMIPMEAYFRKQVVELDKLTADLKAGSVTTREQAEKRFEQIMSPPQLMAGGEVGPR